MLRPPPPSQRLHPVFPARDGAAMFNPSNLSSLHLRARKRGVTSNDSPPGFSATAHPKSRSGPPADCERSWRTVNGGCSLISD